jgi:translation initiation factor 4G
MYARLCRIQNVEGKPIMGGQLIRKYLLNRCQEDFEHGWTAKEVAVAAAASRPRKMKPSTINRRARMRSRFRGVHAAQKAKRQGLRLIKFIGELFQLQMLTDRIMHECVKQLLGIIQTPEEIEGLGDCVPIVSCNTFL